MKNYKVLGLLLLIAFELSAQKNTQKGLLALEQHNYGLAQAYFYKDFKKDSLSAAFGLLNYYMSDFTAKNDSAYHYMLQTNRLWSQTPEKNKASIQKRIPISDSILIELYIDLARKELNLAVTNASIQKLNQVIERYGSRMTSIDQVAAYHRDSLAYQQALSVNSAQALAAFIQQYPNAKQQDEAKAKYEYLLYNEQTEANSEADLMRFIEQNPQSPYVFQAWKRVFAFYQAASSITQYNNFLKNYPAAPQTILDEVWKAIYKLYMQPYSAEKIAQFKIDYPAYPFLEDLAQDGALLLKKFYPFVQQNAYGYMDANGEVVIAAQYDEASPYYEGLAIASKNEKYGLINKKNEVILPFQYVEITAYSSGFLLEDSLGFYLTDFQGKKRQDEPMQWEEAQQVVQAYSEDHIATENLAPSKYQQIEKNGKLGLLLNGKKILEPRYDALLTDSPTGIITAKLGKGLHYFDSTGKRLEINGLEWFLNASDMAQFNQKGIAVCYKTGRYGLIDQKGKMRIKCTYDMALPVHNAVWPVQLKGSWGLVSLDEKVLLPLQYQRIVPYSNYGFLVENTEGLGLVDAMGSWILEPKYKAIKSFGSAYFLVENENGLGVYHNNGESLLECAFQRIVALDEHTFQLTTSSGIAYYDVLERKLIVLKL